MQLNDRTLHALSRMDLDDPRHRAAVAEALPILIERVRELAADKLLAHLRSLSRKYAKAVWAEGIEYSVWRAIEDGPETATEEEITLADELSQEAGGWWTKRDDVDMVLVPLDAWQEMYDAHVRQDGLLRTENARLHRTIERLRSQIDQGEPE